MSTESAITYVSVPLLSLSTEQEFPRAVYLCLHHKMVRYRNQGDHLDSESFNKLIYNQVKFIFIDENDREAFSSWITSSSAPSAVEAGAEISEDAKPILEATQEQRRAMMDVFSSPKDDRQVREAVEASKQMVTEFLKKPYSVNNIQSLQKYSKGCVDHSVNVSIMSVFLGLRMGYAHQIILENLALGGLFHDLGKVLVEPRGEGITGGDDAEMQEHPRLGKELLEKMKEIPNEVRMIVAQHHECVDGSGYPSKLKGLGVYDLARVVSIANIYDNFISESKAPTMKDRANQAVDRLEKEFPEKLDPKKLEKVVKILRYSFL